MKRLTAVIIAIVMCTGICSIPAMAKDTTVKVRIAPFKTTILEQVVDNANVEYPLITYKDITYFPMTYDMCAALWLCSGFDSEKGLFITKHFQDSYGREIKPYGENKKNYYNKDYQAVIPTYPIYLNGISIDNSKEEYPLLNFRGVTYFPMTWRFAYEELNFDIEWSEKDYSFTLKRGDDPDLAYPHSTEGNNMILWDKVSVYDPHFDENGNVTGGTLIDSWWKKYLFDTEAETISFLGDDREIFFPKEEYDRSYGRIEGTELSLTVKDKGIYCGDDLLMTIEGDVEKIDPSAMEYKTDKGSIIYLLVYLSNAPAPYTPHNEYILVKDKDGIRALDWDDKNNFSGIFADKCGGYYICSSGYSPYNAGRWSNSFSDICHYNPENDKFVSLADKYSDIINSIQAIGVSGSKLYVKAIWYDAQKYSGNSTTQGAPISAVNSGYYTIDLESGAFEKIYPYIDGELYLSPDGTPYCFTTYARNGRIVNLDTGKIIEYYR